MCLYLHAVPALLFAYSQGEGGGGHLLTKDKEATLISYLPSKIRLSGAIYKRLIVLHFDVAPQSRLTSQGQAN